MMSSTNRIHSDEYVAKLLAEDARNSSIKYSSMGLAALLPKRPTNSAPKPNTRFLQSILRETDSHNAALKKREELEARLRLRNMRDGHSSGRDSEGRETKKRRRHVDDEDMEPRDNKRTSRTSREEDDRKRRRGQNHERQDSHRSRRDDTSSCDGYQGRKDRRRPLSHTDRHTRDRSSSPDEDRRHRRRRNSTPSSSSPDRHRSRRHRRDRGSERSRTHPRKASDRSSPSRNASPPASDDQRAGQSHSADRDSKKRSSSPTPTPTPSSSSDPLEDIVGPLPPPASQHPRNVKDPPPLISRGRGSYRPSSSTIDTHFSSAYDPALDLVPTSPSLAEEREDWDMALEALRDREIWRRKGAERLRDAGFGEDEVRKWEETASGNAGEKAVEDVRWRARGEQREWDAGKAAPAAPGERDRKGRLELEAAWKRRHGGFAGEVKRALS